MYINFRQLAASDMTPNDLANLLAIRQKDTVMIEAMLEKDAGRYIELGLVEKLKSGVMRLTNKGTSFVNYIETPEMTDEVLETLKIMIGMYESYSKDIGVSRKEAESRLCWFMGNTSFKKEVILQVTESYIAESGDYTMSLCNFIWKPSSQAFSVHMNLKNSKLFDLIAEKFKIATEPYLEPKKNKEMDWLFAVSKLPTPPAKGNPDYLFTGSAETDKERLKNIKTYLFNKIRKQWKVRIRKIIEDIIITQFLNSEMDIVHEEDVSFKELGLDSVDQIELDAMVEQKFNIVIIDYDMETIKDMTDLVYKIITEGYGK